MGKRLQRFEMPGGAEVVREAGRKWLGKRGGRVRPFRVIRGEKPVILQILETVGDP